MSDGRSHSISDLVDLAREQQASERQRFLDEIAELRRQLHEAEDSDAITHKAYVDALMDKHAAELGADTAITRADAAEERLAIQIEANLAQAEVIEELEMRLNLTIPEGEYKEYSDGG